MKRILKPAAYVLVFSLVLAHLPDVRADDPPPPGGDAGDWITVDPPPPGGDAGDWITVDIDDDAAPPPAGNGAAPPAGNGGDATTERRKSSSSSSDTIWWIAGGVVVVGIVGYLFWRHRRSKQDEDLYTETGMPEYEHRFNDTVSLVIDSPLNEQFLTDPMTPDKFEPIDLFATKVSVRVRF